MFGQFEPGPAAPPVLSPAQKSVSVYQCPDGGSKVYCYCKTMTVRSGHTMEYCAHLSEGDSAPDNVLYFFHGLGGSAEDIFSDQFRQVYDNLKYSLNGNLGHVVSISFGPTTIIAPESQGQNAPTPTDVLWDAIPKIEAATVTAA